MKFKFTKNKITEIAKRQVEIYNALFHKRNVIKKLKAFPTVTKTITTLYESEYMPFETTRAFGGLSPIRMDLPIVTQDITFTGSLYITESMIPYVRHSIIVKKPVLGSVRGLYTANILSYDVASDTQAGIFQENVAIRNQAGAIIGNTGSGEGTGDPGDLNVSLFSNPLFTTAGQRSVYSESTMFSLDWTQTQENLFDFSIDKRVMFIVPTDENVGVANSEGYRNYVATVFVPPEPDPSYIVYYTLTDNRVTVNYDGYRPIEADIEAKLILSIPARNIWEEYKKYEN